MKLYLVAGMTESGDEYSYIWKKRPTPEQIEATLRRDWSFEFGEEDDSPESEWTINMPDRAEEIETED